MKPGQHVPGARGGEPGRRVFGDRGPPAGFGHDGVGALQQNDRAGEIGRHPSAIVFGRIISRLCC